MAKKEKEPLSENLLKAWGAVAFIGLPGRLFYYIPKSSAGNSRAERSRKKRWFPTFILSFLILTVLFGALYFVYPYLHARFFPQFSFRYSLPENVLIFGGIAVAFLLSLLITGIKTARCRR